MPNKPNNPTRFARKNIAKRLRELGNKSAIPDTTRQILQNQFDATALYWFLQGGGTVDDFEKLYNAKKMKYYSQLPTLV
jgi:hypothetical protein